METWGPFTRRPLKKTNNNKTGLNDVGSNNIYIFTADMLESTPNDVVPMPDLVWCRTFT